MLYFLYLLFSPTCRQHKALHMQPFRPHVHPTRN